VLVLENEKISSRKELDLTAFARSSASSYPPLAPIAREGEANHSLEDELHRYLEPQPVSRSALAVLDPQTVVEVLAEIAETASGTLELQDVFSRVAASVGRVISFDHMGVVRILEGRFAVTQATTVECWKHGTACVGPLPLTSWSPRLRPRPGQNPRIDDTLTELDASFSKDADLLRAGVRSAMWEPFPSGEAFSGGVWLSSFRPRAFTEDDQRNLRPIAALLGSAVQHWTIWNAERRRRERLEQLDGLLGTLAESLDVREVFQGISDSLQPVLPHQLLSLTELDERLPAFRLVAFAGECDAEAPVAPVPLSAEEAARTAEPEIYRDMGSELTPDSERNRLLLATGMRSWLRVPVLLAGKVHGMIGFFHRDASRYDETDLEVSRRIADRIALALSYHRLAEEARIAADARERAARLEATVETLVRDLNEEGGKLVVGASPAWRNVLFHVGRVASSDTTVLVTGESGTGKEVVARLIHHGSPRSGKPLVAINCAALPEQLLESELFGHEKGAFTGAIATKIGRIEQAAGGTLFLDEIAEMSPAVQSKFLRVLEEREFQRVGGTRTMRAEIRVIAATNRDLAEAIARGEFREDLFYRLNVFQIRIPALRERSEDVLPLAESFLDALRRKTGRPAAGISKDARTWLLEYHWPGNVRELRNAMERAILLCDGGLITREHLPAASVPRAAGLPSSANGESEKKNPLPPNGVDLVAMDRELVEKALRQARGNKTKAARLLGLTRSQLYSRLSKYQLVY
jgi:two-component system NtrC family response regulator